MNNDDKASQKDLTAYESGTVRKILAKQDQFAILWARLCAAYPRQDISAATIAVYYERLSKFTQVDLTIAMDRALDGCKFFPTIADIIESMPRRGVWDRKL